MNVKEEAARLHSCGFNCAQGVLSALRDYTGLPDETALALAAPFGGGVRCGEICGAVSGAAMAIGLAFPFSDGADGEARRRIATLTNRCTGAFKEQFGCLRCLDLKKAGQPCPRLIEYAVGLAEDIITENK